MPAEAKMANSKGSEIPRKGGDKLGVVSGVYIPVCLSILSILMFLRFGLILGQIGLLGILGMSASLLPPSVQRPASNPPQDYS